MPVVADAGADVLPVFRPLRRTDQEPGRLEREANDVADFPANGRVTPRVQMNAVAAGIVGPRRFVLGHDSGSHEGIEAAFADQVIKDCVVGSDEVEAHGTGAETPFEIHVVDEIILPHETDFRQVPRDQHGARSDQEIRDEMGFAARIRPVGAEPEPIEQFERRLPARLGIDYARPHGGDSLPAVIAHFPVSGDHAFHIGLAQTAVLVEQEDVVVVALRGAGDADVERPGKTLVLLALDDAEAVVVNRDRLLEPLDGGRTVVDHEEIRLPVQLPEHRQQRRDVRMVRDDNGAGIGFAGRGHGVQILAASGVSAETSILCRANQASAMK